MKPYIGKQEAFVCCLCGKKTWDDPANPEPLAPASQKCCNDCDQNKVTPARIKRARAGKDPYKP